MMARDTPGIGEVRIPTAGAVLSGGLSVPVRARGIVVFAHGSGSSRCSPRNRYVAGVLQSGGLATLLFDLLTEGEERIDLRTRALRFDIPLLASRLIGAIDWVRGREATRDLPIAAFGASTGAAAALIAAAERPDAVRAVVSRGGRPDLAGERLEDVRAPTLLVVGGLDEPVIEMNRDAMARMKAPVELVIVPGATHLFEEPGKLEQVAALARDWLLARLGNEAAMGSGRARSVRRPAEA